MGGIEKAAFLFGLIVLCAGGAMIIRPHETYVRINSVDTGYSGGSGDYHLSLPGMRIAGIVTSLVGIGFTVAARFGTRRSPQGSR